MGIKKYRRLNSSDGGNIRDRVKIAGEVIGFGDEIETPGIDGYSSYYIIIKFTSQNARFVPRKSLNTLADNLHDVMVETLPVMVDKHIKDQVVKQVPKQVRNQVPVYVAKGLILERQKAKEETEIESST
ncbi:hypothetical protein Tco_0487739 [Tanacetum coccineum]